MTNYDQHNVPVAYPAAAATAYPYPPQGGEAPHVVATAPVPIGYPTKDVNDYYPPPHSPLPTKTRGDGFWKGCCAALCCCCVLDMCF